MPHTYMLRTCNSDMTSRGGFRWPKSGEAVAPDWSPNPKCGGGLHGLLHGIGDGSLLEWADDARWIVCRIAIADIVDLGDKIKVPRAEVVYLGDQRSATDYLRSVDPVAAAGAVVGAFVTSGDRGASVSGDDGTSISGDDGASTSGMYGKSISGDGGKSISGMCGTSTSGDGGTSTSGMYGKSISGDGGTLAIWWDDGIRARLAVAYVGENGIKPNVPYRLDEDGKFVEVKNDPDCIPG